jgi:uncharacterized protein YndB with AHSA1/START domain
VASSERTIPVPPEAVWDALADPAAYGYWVLGSKHVRDADDAWPAPGSRFHHTVGIGPFELRDDTVALAAERPRLLRMRARARPFGSATVTLTLAPLGTGTRVRMDETPNGLLPRLLAGNPLADRLVAWRNARSLARLDRVARQAA